MKKFIDYIFVIFLILTCNSVYSVLTAKDLYFKEIMLAITMIYTIVHIYSNDFEKKRTGKSVALIIIYIFYIAMYIILTKIVSEFIYLYVLLLPLLYFIYSTTNHLMKSTLENFSNIVLFLAIISLIFYFLGTITNIIKPTGNVEISWGGIKTIDSYFGMHFNIQKQDIFGLEIYRNTGIFTEAPMYSLVLSISLCIELFFKEKISKKRIILIFITILTSLSTTGILISMTICFLRYIINMDKVKMIRYLKILILPIVAVTIILISYNIFNNKMKTSSYSTRIDDYIASYKAFKDKPLIGNGFKNDDAIIKYMSSFRSNNEGLSNSFMVLLAQGGIYMSIIYFIPFINTLYYSIKNKKKNIIILDLLLGVLFLTTIFLYKPLLINFLAMGYAVNKKTKNKELCKNELKHKIYVHDVG